MKTYIKYAGVELEADYSWPSDDLEDLEVSALRVGGVDIWSALMQAASDGAKAVGDGYGLTRQRGDEALADRLYELVAKEVERENRAEAEAMAVDRGLELLALARAA